MKEIIGKCDSCGKNIVSYYAIKDEVDIRKTILAITRMNTAESALKNTPFFNDIENNDDTIKKMYFAAAIESKAQSEYLYKIIMKEFSEKNNYKLYDDMYIYYSEEKGLYNICRCE